VKANSPVRFFFEVNQEMRCGAKIGLVMSSVKKTAERLIKKYPNRRLYDTQTSSYITLTDVKQLVLDSEAFTVVDAKSNDDLTRSILLQIILEEEASGAPMFSTDALAQIIRYYGHAMQGMMGSYLEKNIQAFTDIQRKFTSNPANFEGKTFSPEMWTQFMNVQAPIMQGMMNNYIDQSKSLFVQMQEQMQNQSKNLFGAFPFAVPPVVPTPTDKK
jgi:polyhydroxyalkanoate synthesis repressor PhaR